MTRYRVLIDDNFHYMDESERVLHDEFGTLDEALCACRSIVNDFLEGAYKPGMSSSELYELYVAFGDDPFIVPVDPQGARSGFSAWEYARERCEQMTKARG
jgi:hypothetical protein